MDSDQYQTSDFHDNGMCKCVLCTKSGEIPLAKGHQSQSRREPRQCSVFRVILTILACMVGCLLVAAAVLFFIHMQSLGRIEAILSRTVENAGDPMLNKGAADEPSSTQDFQPAYSIKAGRSFGDLSTSVKRTANCSEVSTSGVRRVDGSNDFVFCQDRSVVIQRRYWPFKLKMDKSWDEYRYGFGMFSEEFWLGLEVIRSLLAKSRWRLQIEVTSNNGQAFIVEYRSFDVASQNDNYRLDVRGHSGNIGDILNCEPSQLFAINGKRFSTSTNYDSSVNDKGSCEKNYGGWWFKLCKHADLISNLNREQPKIEQCDKQSFFAMSTKLAMRVSI